MEPANPTEEGLASLNTVLLRDEPCLIRAAMLYYTVTKAADLSFCELFNELGRYIRDPDTKWDYCLRAKRGYSDTSKPGKPFNYLIWLQHTKQNASFATKTVKSYYEKCISNIYSVILFSICHILGAFQKDQVYLKGLLKILKYRHIIDFNLLFRLGKVCFKDIDRLKNFADLENTRLPSFVENIDKYVECLDNILRKNGLTDRDLENM